MELGVVAALERAGAAQVFLRSCRRSGRCFECLPTHFSEQVFGESGGSGSYNVLQRLLCRGRNFPCTGLRGGVNSCASLSDISSDSLAKRRRFTSLLHDAGVHDNPWRRFRGERPVPQGVSKALSSRLLVRETDLEVIRWRLPWGEMVVSEGGRRRRKSLCAVEGSGHAGGLGGNNSGIASCGAASGLTFAARRHGAEVARLALCLRAANMTCLYPVLSRPCRQGTWGAARP